MDKQVVWEIREDPPESVVAEIASDLSIQKFVAGLIWQRGIKNSEDAKRFLYPSLDDLEDPFLILGMDKAVDRIQHALGENERIGIFGDFDADGITATALLYRYFHRIGVETVCRLPNRLTEGYGLSRVAIDEMHSNGVSLLITVDCGITNCEEVDYATSKGIDCIITDHHQPKDILPEAAAILDPKRADCSYPNDTLTGVGLAWKLADALCSRGCGDREELTVDLDLVAVGTIADVAPVTGENRILVRHGLNRLSESGNTGFRNLIDASGTREINVSAVAFRLAPRINAAGRLGDPAKAFQLLITETNDEALELSHDLESINRKRRKLDSEILQEALDMLGGEKKPGAIVLAADGWHTGVIGIVASRLKELYSAPVVMIALKDGIGRGSARSLKGFPLHEILEECSPMLVTHGGHAMAAGIRIEETMIPQFRERFQKLFLDVEEEVESPGKVRIDREILLSECSGKLLKAMQTIGPFGNGNSRPVLMARGISTIGGFRPVGEDHLKFRAVSDGLSMDAIAFRAGHGAAKEWAAMEPFDMAFTLEENRWGGETRLQLNVKGIRPSTRA